ncbi:MULTISPECIES: flagellar motor switch protein FliN [Phyllobacterium]|jgi:flagellar motor switch protein FliN|uniref:flagellar motor switch protein FliN n=1 Tax=Phyllobacterium TaxID=28100 RepID=UPI001CCD4B59|nr:MULTISPECIES: flagellar motor switch protein FliN [unclassified Phyllobacterium]MBZ9603494.1 flagellar motor switch protein FliN [Phyllobacterium sp. KW56]
MAISDKNSIEDELNEAIEDLKRDDAQPNRKSAGTKPNIDLIMGIPVDVQVVLGSTSMPVANLMKLGRGAVVTLDKQIGDPVDIVVNGRVIARGEVIVLEDDSSRFGVSLTEVIGSGI